MTNLDNLQTVDTTAKKKTANTKVETFKNQGAALRKTNTDVYAEGVEGSKQDKVAFVAALGNPAKSQPRIEGNMNKPSYQVVGYRFRLLEDMEVPSAPLKEECKGTMDTEPITMVAGKAGQEVDLNIIETAYMISQPQFAGKFTGEGQEVILTAKCSKSREDLLPVLRKSNGTIKEPMILIADMVGADENSKGKAQVKEEFTKFSPLFRKRTSSRGASKNVKAVETAANLAAAFFDLYTNTKKA